jgi:hypothetical protein
MSRTFVDYLTNPGADQTALEAAISGRIPNPTTPVKVTAAYTLQASDNGQILRLNDAASVLLTIPNSLPVGFSCGIIQGAAGRITAQAQTGGAVASVDAFLKSRKLNSYFVVLITDNAGGSAAQALLIGDLGA